MGRKMRCHHAGRTRDPRTACGTTINKIGNQSAVLDRQAMDMRAYRTGKTVPMPLASQGFNSFLTDGSSAADPRHRAEAGPSPTLGHSQPDVTGFTIRVASIDCESYIIVLISIRAVLLLLLGRGGRPRGVEERVATLSTEEMQLVVVALASEGWVIQCDESFICN